MKTFDTTKCTVTEEEAFEALVSIRDSGITNMWGAAPFLAQDLGISDDEATHWLITWIKSFD